MTEQAYKTPKIYAKISFAEKKSEFIGYIKPAASEKEAQGFLEEIRASNRKANHNCWAYVIRSEIAAGGTTVRYSDDGEPSGTAGAPILDVLTKAGLTGAVCVVTRYFGGILLGAGGLVRAYSKAASLAVSEAGIRTMSAARKLCVTLEYPLYSKIERVFTSRGLHVESRDFSENVTLTLVVHDELADKFIQDLIESCNGAVVVEFIQNEYFDFG
ncbi:MAG: IMPACT family protein [Oscillospiraceae bacterium]|nr:IMPACT family protein [Oscillospiraceae bacterium]